MKFYKDIYFWIFLFSLLFTFGGCLFFGIKGKPAEMGIILVAGASGMAFSNIDKIQYFRIGKWMEIMMKLEHDLKRIESRVPPEIKPEISKVLENMSTSIATSGIFYTHPWEKEYAKGPIGEEASPTIYPKMPK